MVAWAQALAAEQKPTKAVILVRISTEKTVFVCAHVQKKFENNGNARQKHERRTHFLPWMVRAI